jgi:hypothetical protein
MASRKEAGTDRQAVEYGDQRVERGQGGETHQVASGDAPRLTTQQGIVVSDDQNTLRAGERGPDVLEDFHFREKIFHFDHERIPERVVHARGYGAHGFFENYEPLTDITWADPFSKAGLRTPVFVRFSTVAGNKGSTDLARDVRGFATKFYTREGNWDLVGNNIPVFFIQDAIKFPDVIHAAKQEPDRGFPQAQTAHDNFWDFASLMPESAHMLMWIMSDRAIPRSFRFMEGFGVHTFRLVNAVGRSTFVKFHWKPKLGLQSVVWNEAVKISGADPDFHRRDLWDAITAGDFPEWELGLQLFDEDFADRFAFDVLDPTKIIPEEEVPVRRVGRLVLDRVVDNFFAETEQVAFCTQNIIPGIDFSNDPAAAGPEFLLPRYSAQAAGRLQLHPAARKRAQVPGRALPAGRAHGHGQPAGPGELRAQLLGPARAAGGPGLGLPHLPRRPGRPGRAQAQAAAGELRRPLQPGAAVLLQPDRGRAAAHHRRVRVRAEQVRPRGDPDPDGGRAAQCRRRPGRRRGRGPGPARAARPAARRSENRPRPAGLPAGTSDRRGRRPGGHDDTAAGAPGDLRPLGILAGAVPPTAPRSRPRAASGREPAS